jgi:transmembrane sensor
MQPITPELLKKYFNGQCSPEEELQVKQWIHSGGGDLSGDDDEVFEGIDKSELKEAIWTPVRPTGSGRRERSWLLRVAAVWFALLSIVGAGYYYWTSLKDEVLAVPVSYKTIETLHGKKMKLALADGTSIYLNAGSVLRVPERFGPADRTVYLTGEAFLEVAKDSLKPFMVVTPHITVRVLGTVFNVRSYSSDGLTRVAVQEGKVRVADSTGQSVLLVKDQAAEYLQKTRSFNTGMASVEDDAAWHTGMMVFKDEPLHRIAATLERWYDIRVDIKDRQLGERRFSGSYGPNPTLHILLKDLSVVMQFNYKLDGKRVVLY